MIRRGWALRAQPASPLLVLGLLAGLSVQSAVVVAQPAPVEYEVAFPSPQEKWLQVDVRFPDLPAGPLDVRMSSASPGRYARHEFAKNLIEVDAFGAGDRALVPDRPAAQVWRLADHGGEVRLRYRLFGDRVDGTYLGVDATHGHLNMPATLMWAEGLETRPVEVRFVPPAGAGWSVATQLFPTDDPLRFTSPNLAYLLDSPTELSAFDLRTFSVQDPGRPDHRPTFRVAVHHDGTGDGVDAYAASVEAIVREMVHVFGEFPTFDTGTYTFIADYHPRASGDAMEHRNSTFLTAPAGIDHAGQRAVLLGAVSHEFFHAWNVERIRPESLEPFDFTDANVSGELWFAEGFTNYYGKLVLARAGEASVDDTVASFGRAIAAVVASPGRQWRSPVQMSRMAPFTDAATAIDPTNFANTFISYYTWGEVIGLALDLALRGRSDGVVTLDHYFRALWEEFGRPASDATGLVARPYVPADLRRVLGDVAGDQAFADEFFARYIDGRELADYGALVERAGLRLTVDPRVPLSTVERAGGRPTPAQLAFRTAWLGSRQ